MGSVLLSVLFLQAPPDEIDAEKLLRVAYASQYEWKEDDVKSVSLDFTWSTSWKGKDGRETRSQGIGHVLVVGDEVVRRHYPATTKSRKGQADGYLNWILERFITGSPFQIDLVALLLRARISPPSAFMYHEIPGQPAPSADPGKKRAFRTRATLRMGLGSVRSHEGRRYCPPYAFSNSSISRRSPATCSRSVVCLAFMAWTTMRCSRVSCSA